MTMVLHKQHFHLSDRLPNAEICSVRWVIRSWSFIVHVNDGLFRDNCLTPVCSWPRCQCWCWTRTTGHWKALRCSSRRSGSASATSSGSVSATARRSTPTTPGLLSSCSLSTVSGRWPSRYAADCCPQWTVSAVTVHGVHCSARGIADGAGRLT